MTMHKTDVERRRHEIFAMLHENQSFFKEKLACSSKFLKYFDENCGKTIIPKEILEAINHAEECAKNEKFLSYLLHFKDKNTVFACSIAFLFLGALIETRQLELVAKLSTSNDNEKLLTYVFKDVTNSGGHLKKLCSSHEVYDMGFGKEGCCLLINIKYFEIPECSTRYGSERDVCYLKKIFKQLNIHVRLRTGLTAKEIEREVNEFVSGFGTFNAKKYRVIFMVIMSHGNRGGVIYGRDGNTVDRHELYKKLYTCQALKGIPKVCVIQACAGVDRSYFEEDARPLLTYVESSEEPIGSPEDSIIFSSSFDGFVSLRHPEKGSPFIIALVMTLESHAGEYHFEKICKKVQNEIRDLNRSYGNIPVPCYWNFLRKKLYLFSGTEGCGETARVTEMEGKLLHNYCEMWEVLNGLQNSDEVDRRLDGRTGRCLIINIDKSDRDEINLKRVFRKLGFSVADIKKDFSSTAIKAAVTDELEQDLKDCQFFVLVLMGTGNKKGWISGNDDLGVDQHDLRMAIYNCEDLKNKPKIFIIDAGTAGEYKRFEYESLPRKIGSVEDVLIVASSFEGSHPQIQLGGQSLFLIILVTLLDKHSHEWHIEKICKMTQVEMRRFLTTVKLPVQIPCYTSFMRYKWYLLPWLIAEEEAANDTLENNEIMVYAEEAANHVMENNEITVFAAVEDMSDAPQNSDLTAPALEALNDAPQNSDATAPADASPPNKKFQQVKENDE